MFGDAADKQCVTIAPNEVETITELRALKARRAREHFVDEVDETCGKVVEWTLARGPGEQGFVPGCQVRFDVLEVIEQLQEDPVPERE